MRLLFLHFLLNKLEKIIDFHNIYHVMTVQIIFNVFDYILYNNHITLFFHCQSSHSFHNIQILLSRKSTNEK